MSASFAAAGVQWFLIAALARLASPVLVGRYALAVALTGPVVLAANLQLRTLVVTDVGGRFSLVSFWKLRFISTAAALALVSAVVWVAGVRGEGVLETALVALGKTIESVAEVYHGVLQKAERLPMIAGASLIKAILSILAFAWTLRETKRLWPALAAVAACQILVLVLVERPAARGLVAAASAGASAFDLARAAAPMGAILLSINLMPAIPRYFVEWRQGPASLGYFAALNCFPAAMQIGLGAVAQASLARLSWLASFDRPGCDRLVARLFAMTAASGAIAIAAASLVTRLAGRLFGPEYAARSELTVWLLVAGAIGALGGTLGTALTARQVIWPQVKVYGAAVAGCALFCLFLTGPDRPAAPAEALALGGLIVTLGHARIMMSRGRR